MPLSQEVRRPSALPIEAVVTSEIVDDLELLMVNFFFARGLHLDHLLDGAARNAFAFLKTGDQLSQRYHNGRVVLVHRQWYGAAPPLPLHRRKSAESATAT